MDWQVEAEMIGRVTETFDIVGRGVVIVTGTRYDQLPSDLKLKVGDPITLRADGELVLQTTIAGIEHCDPWTPKRLFAFLLGREIARKDIPLGAEVWAGE